MIADVIRKADTEHVIYCLLTAYIETVPFRDGSDSMPEQLTRLPLHGMADVRARFDNLFVELDVASKQLDNKACAVIREALYIFAAALNRLRALEGNGLRPLRGIDAQAA